MIFTWLPLAMINLFWMSTTSESTLAWLLAVDLWEALDLPDDFDLCDVSEDLEAADMEEPDDR